MSPTCTHPRSRSLRRTASATCFTVASVGTTTSLTVTASSGCSRTRSTRYPAPTRKWVLRVSRSSSTAPAWRYRPSTSMTTSVTTPVVAGPVVAAPVVAGPVVAVPGRSMSTCRTTPSTDTDASVPRSGLNPSMNSPSSNARPTSRTERRCFLHRGQPRPRTRFAPLACHSWSGCSRHCHQSFLPVPATTSSGARSPFFVGCHSAPSCGCAATLLVTEARMPAQNGQPRRPWARLAFPRTSGEVCHSWSGPSAQRHHTGSGDPPRIWSGVRPPLRVGCHRCAPAGYRAAKLLVTDSCRPAQHGHPVKPFSSDLLMDAGPACQRWSSATGHAHARRRLERDPMVAGSTVFASVSHKARSAGTSTTAVSKRLPMPVMVRPPPPYARSSASGTAGSRTGR